MKSSRGGRKERETRAGRRATTRWASCAALLRDQAAMFCGTRERKWGACMYA